MICAHMRVWAAEFASLGLFPDWNAWQRALAACAPPSAALLLTVRT